ncbi:MAG: Beta-ketoadipate enol-lactone hydrolase [uncultured Acidimicrobiales bacterium]|uniref:Beta-ketoadipate enol-lactone hydrolase n=1 Tax=uncultured Acidimicrobiales bacterium TaxID=310071 RepID=A0A6J4H747_9ACTN|nr:MAG: Beta-ketoadipate enol-lactone hydrolase [uncultured Acidimicrobiales bacterium]
MVHGFASSFELNWRETGWVDLLSDAGREVIGVDLLGHGSADKPHDPSAYDHVEDDIRAALPEEGQVDAVAFSMGARILLGVAAAEPHRFRSLIVSGIGAGVFATGGSSDLADTIEHGSNDETSHIGRLFSQFAAGSGNDRQALAAFLRRKTAPLTPEQLGRITCPVLVVIGDQDFALPVEPLVEAFPNAKLVVLKGTDHFATPKDFKFLDAALQFLGAT